MSTNNTLDQHQKMTLAMVIIIAIVALVIGVFYLRKSLFAPFLRSGTVEFKTSEQLEQERITAMKTKDTDKDALSDFDELYVYRTSPYLDDSDSDGKIDSAEIADNTDPNCPEGQQCHQTTVDKPANATGTDKSTAAPDGSPNNSSTPTANTAPAATPDPNANPVVTGMDAPAQAVYSIFGDVRYLTKQGAEERIKTLSDQQIREFFAKMGIPDDQVAKFNNTQLRAALLQSVSEIIQNQAKTPAGSPPVGTDATAPQP